MSSVRNKIVITGYSKVDGQKDLGALNVMEKNTAESIHEDYTNVKNVSIKFLSQLVLFSIRQEPL